MTLRAHYGNMQMNAEDIRRIAEDLEERKESLSADIKRAAEAWLGASSDAYQYVQREWNADMDILIHVLYEIVRTELGAQAGLHSQDIRSRNQLLT